MLKDPQKMYFASKHYDDRGGISTGGYNSGILPLCDGVVCDGQTLPGVAGTSCATPAFSGVVALLVDRRLAAGKSALGFLNPLLYSDAMTRALNDVTSGAGRGCAAGPGKGGWPALAGWDAVTGWGTPNMGKMAAVTDALP